MPRSVGSPAGETLHCKQANNQVEDSPSFVIPAQAGMTGFADQASAQPPEDRNAPYLR